MKIKTNPPDQQWVLRAVERGFTLETGDPTFLPLKQKLLDIGGWSVCTPAVDHDLTKILKRGRRFPGKSRTMRGEPCHCHSNSAMLWFENQEETKICTGYALTRDGMWRQHSWVLHNSGLVIETTVKRVQYFGFVMTHDESKHFMNHNF